VDKILVTGGVGYLGQWVVKELEKHYNVVVADLNLPNYETSPNTVYKKVDLKNSLGLDVLLDNIDAVVHLAAIPRPVGYKPEDVFETNMVTTFNIVEASIRANVKKIIFSSSGSSLGFAYSFTEMIPDYMPIDEEHPLRPQDSYGLSKAFGEDILKAATIRSGISTIALRPTTVIVPADYEERVPQMLSTKQETKNRMDVPAVIEGLNGGNEKQTAIQPLSNPQLSYVDARDYAQGVLLALQNNEIEHDIFFITADDAMSREPVSKAFPKIFPGSENVASKLTGIQSPISSEKAKRILGYKPKYSWRDFVK
jgi:nucleoside-diphosphate-sugar epimerase